MQPQAANDRALNTRAALFKVPAAIGARGLATIRSLLVFYRIPLLAFLLSFLLFLISKDYIFSKAHLTSYTTFDANWYGRIIGEGYSTNGNDHVEHDVVFFPLYPIACYIVKMLLPISTAAAMLAVAATSSMVMLLFFYDILRRNQSPGVAARAVLLLAFNPFSCFFYNGYSDALFLCLAVLFFWVLLKGRFFSSAIIAGFASACRPYGALLGIVLAFELVRLHYAEFGLRFVARSKYLLYIAVLLPVCCAGLAAYTIYLGSAFGDPLAFAHGLRAWSSGRAPFSLADLIGMRYLLKAFVAAFIPSDPFRPFVVGMVYFALMPVLVIFRGSRLAPAILFFTAMMFVFIHLNAVVNRIELYNLGRHCALLFPVAMLGALALAPRQPPAWQRRIARSPGRPEAGRREWIQVFAAAPFCIVLLSTAALSVRYTIMYYRNQFVS